MRVVFTDLPGLSDQKGAMWQFRCDAVSLGTRGKEASLIIISLVYILLKRAAFFTVLFFWCTMVQIYNKSNGQLL